MNYEELKKEALVLADRADRMSEDTLTSDAVKALIAYADNKDARLTKAHAELISLYKSLEKVAQPRTLAHIITIGAMLENALTNTLPTHKV